MAFSKVLAVFKTVVMAFPEHNFFKPVMDGKGRASCFRAKKRGGEQLHAALFIQAPGIADFDPEKDGVIPFILFQLLADGLCLFSGHFALPALQESEFIGVEVFRAAYVEGIGRVRF